MRSWTAFQLICNISKHGVVSKMQDVVSEKLVREQIRECYSTLFPYILNKTSRFSIFKIYLIFKNRSKKEKQFKIDIERS